MSTLSFFHYLFTILLALLITQLNLSIAIKDAVSRTLEKNMHYHNSRQVGIVSSVDEITNRPKVFKGLGYLRLIEN